MTRLLTKTIATMTELRDPQKVLDRANGEPVAILRNSKLVAYLVPAERTGEAAGHRPATLEDVKKHLQETRAEVQPVLDWLRDR